MDPSSSDEPQKPQNENQNDSVHIPIQSDNASENPTFPDVVEPSSEPWRGAEPQVILPTKIEVADQNNTGSNIETGGATSEPSPSAVAGSAEQPVPAVSQEQQSAPASPQPPQPAPSAVPTPATDTLFQSDANAPAFAASPKNSGGKKKAVLFTGILAVLLLLGGAFAAAYYGVVVPNTPENVLRQAVKNTANQEYVSSTTKIDVAPTGNSESSSVTAMKIEGKTNSDVLNNAYEGSFKVTASGVDVTLDAKYIDKNAYIKVGSLDTVTSLAGAALAGGTEGAQLKAELDKAAAVIEEQWIEVDSTVLDQANISCSLDGGYRLTDGDLKLLEDQFSKHPFIAIGSHTDDKVNDRKAKKYTLTLDTKKAGEFADEKKLEELSFVKKLKECTSDEGSATDPSALKDSVEGNVPEDEKYTFDVWVDAKEKVISKVAFSTDNQKEKPKDYKVSVEAVLNYNKVSIEKPKDAKPVLQIFGDLQQASPELFGTLGMLLGGIGSTDGASEADDTDDANIGDSGDVIFESEFSDDL